MKIASAVMRVAFSVWLMMQLVGCASTRILELPEVPAPGEGLAEREITVVAYTTRDGLRREFSGTVRLADGTYHFTPHAHNVPEFALLQNQIASFEIVDSTDATRLTAVLLTVSAVLVGLFLTTRIHWAG